MNKITNMKVYLKPVLPLAKPTEVKCIELGTEESLIEMEILTFKMNKKKVQKWINNDRLIFET